MMHIPRPTETFLAAPWMSPVLSRSIFARGLFQFTFRGSAARELLEHELKSQYGPLWGKGCAPLLYVISILRSCSAFCCAVGFYELRKAHFISIKMDENLNSGVSGYKGYKGLAVASTGDLFSHMNAASSSWNLLSAIYVEISFS